MDWARWQRMICVRLGGMVESRAESRCEALRWLWALADDIATELVPDVGIPAEKSLSYEAGYWRGVAETFAAIEAAERKMES